MMKRILGIVAVISCFVAKAQLLTWSPSFPVENNTTQTLTITVDATKGNKGLLNYTPNGDVYVHIGVITNLSNSASDWKYVKFTWGTTSTPAQATYLGNNKWQYAITGSLRTFFGVTNTSETIRKIAILFRNGSGTQKQANSDGSDMYIPVYGSSLAVSILQPSKEPRFVPVPEPQNLAIGSIFTFKADASKPATIKLYDNGTVIATATNAQTASTTATVSAAGEQQLIAEATDGATTTYDTLSFYIAPATTTAALPAGVRDGINYEAGNTSVVLVLDAPGKTKASVIGDFNNWTETVAYSMNKTPDGKKFWLRITGLMAGTEYGYQYKVDDSIKIADPYTEKVLDPDNDASITAATYPGLKAYPAGKTTGIVSVLQTGQTAYNWTSTNYTRPDKKTLVLYELLVRDFVAAHDWKTLADTLGYLKNLGINAIEVMPFNEFEGNNSWGYNPDFYFAPDKYYGPKNTLKQFVDACHKNGIAVVMDIALNHSFGSSPMVQLYWDAANNRPAVNNPWFNPVAKHAYNVGYDMNHESLNTKYFVSRVLEHWLTEYKIDGFRFDLAKGFTQKQTCDNNGGNCNVSSWSAYDASRVAIWKGYYDTVQTKSSNAYVILEHFADNTEEKELSDYGMMLWGNLNANYAQAALGYSTPDPGGNTWNFSNGIFTQRGWTKSHLVTYMESHDEERIQYKNELYGNASGSYNIKDISTGLKRVELDAAFFFTIPGPKMIWQFGELGYDYPINYCANGTVSNDCRLSPKPIRWDYYQNAQRKEVYDEFASLIKLRFHPLYKDAFVSNRIDQSLDGAFKWIKLTTDTSNLVVVGNFDVTATTGTVAFQSAGTWYDYLTKATFTATGSAQNITLQPGEFHVYVNRNITNTTATAVPNVIWNENALEAKVYPNPSKQTAWLEMNMPQSSAISIDVINSIGQKLASLPQGFLIKGRHIVPLNNIFASAGNYYLKITTKSYQKTIQVIIQ